jgi:hypothetical protein
MFDTNADRIRFATDEDADTLRGLAERSSQRPLEGRVLIGHIDGTPAAALSLDDERVIVDPSRRTGRLVVALRMRAAATRAYEATPSLRERLVAALPAWRGSAMDLPATASPAAVRTGPPSWDESHAGDQADRDLAA